jgi:hypothetical protein
MNGKKTLACLLSATLLLATVSLTMTGCGTPPERKAFSAAVGTRMGVEASLEVFKEQVRQGKVSPDQLSLARRALNTYKAADDAYLAALEVSITTKDTSAADRAQAIWKATYGDLWKILVVYVPSMDPNPPGAN